MNPMTITVFAAILALANCDGVPVSSSYIYSQLSVPNYVTPVAKVAAPVYAGHGYGAPVIAKAAIAAPAYYGHGYPYAAPVVAKAVAPVVAKSYATPYIGNYASPYYGQYAHGASHYAHAPAHYAHGPAHYAHGPAHYAHAPAHYAHSPAHYGYGYPVAKAVAPVLAKAYASPIAAYAPFGHYGAPAYHKA
ncbi:hypothetical protein HDE_09840 [Halotydeus destructor]|nr:hypothetical protein HDE_09840 [Halotydeus destructor]